MDTSGNKILIVVPTYNERENIGPLVKGIYSSLGDPHILFIDDASPDGTGDLVEEMARKDPRNHLIRRPGKMGLGTAYIRGFSFFLDKGYDLCFEMDADLSHNPRDLPRFTAMMKEFDLVIGTRYIPGGETPNWGIMRKVISRGGNAYAKAILGIPFTDFTSGFRCYRRRALEAVDLRTVRSEGYAFQIEMAYKIWKKGFRIGELPIVFNDRRVGESKMSWGIFFEAAWEVLRLRLT